MAVIRERAAVHRTGTLVWWSVGTYFAISLLSIGGLYGYSPVPYLYFAWPYATLLALQKFLSPGPLASALGVILAGSLGVALTATAVRSHFVQRGPVAVALVGLAISVGCIAIFSIVPQLVARALGWPFGE